MKLRTFLVSTLVTLTVASAAFAQDDPDSAPPAADAAPAAAAPAPPDSEATGAKEHRTAKNAIYAELLGPAVLFSINYDRAFTDNIAGRVGLSYWGFKATGSDGSEVSASITMIPLTVSYLGIGSLNHMLEIGAGGVVAYAQGSASFGGSSSSDSGLSGWGTAIVGYRYQPSDGGFTLRVGMSPLFGSGGFVTWPYLSLGGAF